ncbi:MAG: hypothetical protein QXT63_01125 [Thermoplasmata archaeon]
MINKIRGLGSYIYSKDDKRAMAELLFQSDFVGRENELAELEH